MILKLLKLKREEKPKCAHGWTKVGERLVDTGSVHCPDFNSHDVLYCANCDLEVTLSPSEARIEIQKEKARKELYA